MQKQITIEQWVGYLPYNLTVQRTCFDNVHVFTLVGINKSYYSEGGWNAKINRDPFNQCLIYLKPHLRPLSSLTKEITHNGETLVPMIEIAKIEAPDIVGASERIYDVTAFNRHISETSIQPGVSYSYGDGSFVNPKYMIEIVHYKEAIFKKRVREHQGGAVGWIYSDFHNYPHILQKLYSWHFDIHGLIDAGLALPIND